MDEESMLRPVGSRENNNSHSRHSLPPLITLGMRHISGINLSDVNVYKNSQRPAMFGALACTQGNEIFLGRRQEKYLPHEAWHVIQQRRGEVKPSLIVSGVPANNNTELEREADVMGARSVAMGRSILSYGNGGLSMADNRKAVDQATPPRDTHAISHSRNEVVQFTSEIDFRSRNITYRTNWVGGTAMQVVGVLTEARLDPDDVVRGSRTGVGAGIYAQGLYRRVNNGRNLTQGHLLNANLGGQAIPENLFPITADLNRKHSILAEEQIKSRFIQIADNRANPLTAGTWGNRRLLYTIEVGHPQIGGVIDPTNIRNTTFRINAFTTDNNDPNGAGGVMVDPALGGIVNLDITVPNNLNRRLAMLGWDPDDDPSFFLGPQLIGPLGMPVFDGAGNPVHAVSNATGILPDLTITVT